MEAVLVPFSSFVIEIFIFFEFLQIHVINRKHNGNEESHFKLIIFFLCIFIFGNAVSIT